MDSTHGSHSNVSLLSARRKCPVISGTSLSLPVLPQRQRRRLQELPMVTQRKWHFTGLCLLFGVYEPWEMVPLPVMDLLGDLGKSLPSRASVSSFVIRVSDTGLLRDELQGLCRPTSTAGKGRPGGCSSRQDR